MEKIDGQVDRLQDADSGLKGWTITIGVMGMAVWKVDGGESGSWGMEQATLSTSSLQITVAPFAVFSISRPTLARHSFHVH
jgi:hypothetical protein